MLQSRALVIALILLLSTTFPEVHSKSIFEKDNRRDWLATPNKIVAYCFETVNNMSPKVGQFLMDVAQTPVFVGARNFFTRVIAKFGAMAEQVMEEITQLKTNVLGY
ncbi:apovitellenin-1-like [Apteryx rowi]|uniref:apovitellenin-1-like n=1 Tax=Apteryx rowi TaxID=308060 RepID=UPI0006B08D68|nr:PREDICTED: apovitellenin-1-like [Apteryx mantelli mantelli]XP_025938370.1 apovitellenin-1-like [Apteryx rowi]